MSTKKRYIPCPETPPPHSRAAHESAKMDENLAIVSNDCLRPFPLRDARCPSVWALQHQLLVPPCFEIIRDGTYQDEPAHNHQGIREPLATGNARDPTCGLTFDGNGGLGFRHRGNGGYRIPDFGGIVIRVIGVHGLDVLGIIWYRNSTPRGTAAHVEAILNQGNS